MILFNTLSLTSHVHTQVSVLNVTTLMVVTTQPLPREGTGDTLVPRGTGRRTRKMMRMRRQKEGGKGSGRRRGEMGENRVAEMETERGEGRVQLTSTFPSVSLGISCYTDGTTHVGVIPRGVAGPAAGDSRARSRILKCQDLESLSSLDSSKFIFLAS